MDYPVNPCLAFGDRSNEGPSVTFGKRNTPSSAHGESPQTQRLRREVESPLTAADLVVLPDDVKTGSSQDVWCLTCTDAEDDGKCREDGEWSLCPRSQRYR